MEFHPLTPDRWDDLVDLFGPNGAYSGCWCMWNRQTNADFEAHHGDDNRAAFRRLVSERPPGLLAYLDGVAIGWVSLGPYEDFGRLARSPVARAVDGTPVWAITCFVIRKGHRRTGVATALLDAAVEYAAANGATVVEGYPARPRRQGEQRRRVDGAGIHVHQRRLHRDRTAATHPARDAQGALGGLEGDELELFFVPYLSLTVTMKVLS